MLMVEEAICLFLCWVRHDGGSMLAEVGGRCREGALKELRNGRG